MNGYNENYYLISNRYRNHNCEDIDKNNLLINSSNHKSFTNQKSLRNRNIYGVRDKNKKINCSQDDINIIKMKMNIDILNNKLMQIKKTFSKIDSIDLNINDKKPKKRNNSMIINDNIKNSSIYNINYNDIYTQNKYKYIFDNDISDYDYNYRKMPMNNNYFRNKSKKNIITNRLINDKEFRNNYKIFDDYEVDLNHEDNKYFNSPIKLSCKQPNSGRLFKNNINHSQKPLNFGITRNFFTINDKNKIINNKNNTKINNLDNLCFGDFDNYFLETFSSNKNNEQKNNNIYMYTISNEKEEKNECQKSNNINNNVNFGNIKNIKDIIINNININDMNNKCKINNNNKNNEIKSIIINKIDNKNDNQNDNILDINDNNNNDNKNNSNDNDNNIKSDNNNKNSELSIELGSSNSSLINKLANLNIKNHEKIENNINQNEIIINKAEQDINNNKNNNNNDNNDIENNKINKNEEKNNLNNNDNNNNNKELIIVNENNNKKRKKISIHEEDNISIEYNQKDKITKISIFDFFGGKKDFKPRNINVILEKLKRGKISPILLNKDAKDNLVKRPKSNKKEKNKINNNEKEKKLKKSSSAKLISSNKEKMLLNKYNIKNDKKIFHKIQKNKTSNNNHKKVCQKFKKNPQLFYTEDLCKLVIKSWDMDENGENKENNKILVNKSNKNSKNRIKIVNRNNIFLNDDNIEDMGEIEDNNIEPFNSLQKIIEESEEEEKNK